MKRTILSMMLLLGGAGAALAGEGPGTPPAVETQRAEPGARMAARLGLDATQTAEVRALAARYRGQLGPVRRDARATRRALAAALATPQPDEREVGRLTSKLLADRQSLAALRLERQGELQKILTPSQFARMVMRQGRRPARRARAQALRPRVG